MSDDKPSIAELQRLCRDESENHDADLALAAPVLLEIAAAALAFVETQGDRYSTEWGDFKIALLKVRR